MHQFKYYMSFKYYTTYYLGILNKHIESKLIKTNCIVTMCMRYRTSSVQKPQPMNKHL